MLNSPLKIALMLASVSAASLLAGGCTSSAKTQKEELQAAVNAPLILNPRSSPEEIELNRFLQPKEPQYFLADVQDLASPVKEVRLRLGGTLIDIPMQRVGGTTWRAELSSDQIKRLAMSGRTIEYKARVIARDERGAVSTSKDVALIRVTAPKFDDDMG